VPGRTTSAAFSAQKGRLAGSLQPWYPSTVGFGVSDGTTRWASASTCSSLCRKLQHGRFLALAKLGQEDDLAVREFQRIVMDVRRLLVDLAEDRRVVFDVLDAAAEEARRFDRNLFRESDLRSRQQTHCRGAFFRRREAPCSGAEIPSGELVAYFSWSRCNAVKAVVTHGKELLC
jgi:hypothetical protein